MIFFTGKCPKFWHGVERRACYTTVYFGCQYVYPAHHHGGLHLDQVGLYEGHKAEVWIYESLGPDPNTI